MSKTNNRRLRKRVREMEMLLREREESNAWRCFQGAAAKLNDLGVWGEELARIVYRLEPHQQLTRTTFEDVTNEVRRLVEMTAEVPHG